MKRGLLLILATLVVLTPTTAFSKENSQSKTKGTESSQGNSSGSENVQVTSSEKEDVSWLDDFSGSFSYTNSVGRGSFLSNEYNRRPSWSMGFGLSGGYTISKALGLSAGFGISVNKTILDNADSAVTRVRETNLGDMSLLLSMANLVKADDGLFTMNAGLSLSLPTSKFSMLAQKYAGLGLNVSMSSKPLKWLSISHSVGASKGFHKYDSVVLDTSEFDFPLVTRLDDPNFDDSAFIATGNGLTEWSLSNTTSLSFTLVEKLSLGISFGYFQNWKYRNIPLDELSSENAIAGRGYSDSMAGSINLSYKAHKHFGLGLGTTTSQTPRTSDNKSFRFPFWDTTNGAANRQSFYLSMTGSF